MATKREGIGKKLRFDVFKRDGFVCQYCGSHPPSVVLEIDHINPVAKGGKNNLENLLTACFNCNRGKRDTPLSVVPQSMADRAKELQERELQLAGYREIQQAHYDRIEDDAWTVVYALFGDETESVNRANLQSIRMFNARLSSLRVVEAANIARAKGLYSDNKLFRYFCGVCWSMIKEENGAR